MPPDPNDPTDAGSWDPQTAAMQPAASPTSNPFLMGQTGGGMGGYGLPSLYDDPGFRRHAAYSALTNMGLALMQASAPTTGPPPNLGSMFGALGGGAAQGVQNATGEYMKQLQMGLQMQNMRLRQQMLNAPLPAPQDSDQSQAPQQAAPAPGATGSPAPGATGAAGNAIAGIESGPQGYGSVGPAADKDGHKAYGKYQVMDYNVGPWTKEALGKELTPAEFLVNPQAQDAVFNKKFGEYRQKYGDVGAAKAWFAGEKGMNNPNATDVNGMSVARYGNQFAANGGAPGAAPGGAGPTMASLPPFQGPGMGDNQPGAQPPGATPQVNLPPTQTAQAGGEPMPMGGDQQQPTGNQPGVMPAPPAGIQMPPMPKVIPYSPRAQQYIASGDKGLEALGKANNAQVDHMNARNQERWKANVALLQHNQTVAMERQKLEQSERNSKVTPVGPNSELATAETQIESAKERGKEEERTRFVYGSSDWANKTPEELRKQVNPEAMTLVDAIQNGQSINNIAQRAGGAGGMDINKNDLLAIGSKVYGKSFDTNFGIQKAEFALNMAPGKKGGDALGSISNATQHLTDAAEAYNDLKNGKYPLANRIFNTAKTASGWGPERGFDAIIQPVATEMAKVISGSSDNSVTEREALREITASWNSPEAMQQVFAKYAGLAQKRINTVYAQAKVYGYDKEWVDKRIGEYGSEALAKIPTSINTGPPQAAAPAAPSMDAINAEMKRRGLAK